MCFINKCKYFPFSRGIQYIHVQRVKYCLRYFLGLHSCRVQCLPRGVFSSNSPGQSHVFRHESNSLGVNGAEQTVLEQSHQVGLACLLKSEYCGGLEPQIPSIANCTDCLSNNSGEWQLGYQQVGRFLELPEHELKYMIQMKI